VLVGCSAVPQLPAPLLVRAIQAVEVPAAGKLVVDAYRSLRGYVAEPAYEAQLADVAGRLPPVAEVLVATSVEPGSPLLGCATVVVDPMSPMSEAFDDGEVGLRMLGVAPAAQGRGVGRALVEATLERAGAVEGATALVLHSTQYMEAAHRLYLGMGFERVPERDIDLMDRLGIELRFFRLPL